MSAVGLTVWNTQYWNALQTVNGCCTFVTYSLRLRTVEKAVVCVFVNLPNFDCDSVFSKNLVVMVLHSRRNRRNSRTNRPLICQCTFFCIFAEDLPPAPRLSFSYVLARVWWKFFASHCMSTASRCIARWFIRNISVRCSLYIIILKCFIRNMCLQVRGGCSSYHFALSDLPPVHRHAFVVTCYNITCNASLLLLLLLLSSLLLTLRLRFFIVRCRCIINV